MRSLIIAAALCLTFSFSSAASAEELKASNPIDAGAADLLPSSDATSDATSSDLQPVAPAAPPAVAPEPSVSSKQFKELDDRVMVLSRSNLLLKADLAVQKMMVASLEDRFSALESVIEEDGSYKFAAVGLGLSFKTAGGSVAALKIQGNLGGFSGFYYVGTGGGVAWSMVIHSGRVRISPLGFGLMVYQDPKNAFTSCWLKRSVDMVLPFSVDVRVWEGITVGAQIAWFIPNPVDVAIASKDAGKSSVENANPTLDMRSLTDVPNNALNDSGDVISRAFGDAFKGPRLEFGAKWTFK